MDLFSNESKGNIIYSLTLKWKQIFPEYSKFMNSRVEIYFYYSTYKYKLINSEACRCLIFDTANLAQWNAYFVKAARLVKPQEEKKEWVPSNILTQFFITLGIF